MERSSSLSLPKNFLKLLDELNEESSQVPNDLVIECTADRIEGDEMRVLMYPSNGHQYIAHIPLTELASQGIEAGDSFQFLQFEGTKFRKAEQPEAAQEEIDARVAALRNAWEGLEL